MTEKDRDYIINEAVDYLTAVTIKQERLLPKKELWEAYQATVGHLTEQGFNIAYDSYEETLRERGII